MVITENQKARKETSEKWNNKLIWDIKYKEMFFYDQQRDWQVLFNYPDRFRELKKYKQYRHSFAKKKRYNKYLLGLRFMFVLRLNR